MIVWRDLQFPKEHCIWTKECLLEMHINCGSKFLYTNFPVKMFPFENALTIRKHFYWLQNIMCGGGATHWTCYNIGSIIYMAHKLWCFSTGRKPLCGCWNKRLMQQEIEVNIVPPATWQHAYTFLQLLFCATHIHNYCRSLMFFWKS